MILTIYTADYAKEGIKRLRLFGKVPYSSGSFVTSSANMQVTIINACYATVVTQKPIASFIYDISLNLQTVVSNLDWT